MKYQALLSPYLLGKTQSTIRALHKPDWQMNLLDEKSGLINGHAIAAIHSGIKKSVSKIVADKMIPLSISGDCCAAIPVIAGLQEQQQHPVIVWLDAHGDFNTEETSTTGSLEGMALAKITGRGNLDMLRATGMKKVEDKDVLLVDCRDLEPAERRLLENSGVRLLKVEEVKHYDFGGRPVYIHFDTDVINASDAPAMRFPVYGGPGPDELADLFQYLKMTQHICAVSATTWEPELDKDGKTRNTCMKLINIFS